MKPIIASLLFASLAACSHAHPVAEAPPAALPAAPAAAPAATPTPTPATPVAAAADRSSLYFDFDSAQLSSADEDTLARVGPLLAKEPSLKMRIEGNCDERGTEEYNLALGQHRAQVAVKYLERMGAGKTQLTAISYGKDRPRATGHDEAAWGQNRRDDLVPLSAQQTNSPVSANP